MMQQERKYKADVGRQQQQSQPLDFVVRPRFGKRFYNWQRETVQLSSVFAKIGSPDTQAEALKQLGIQLVSRSRVKLDLLEFPPGYKQQQQDQQQLQQQQQQEQEQQDHANHDHAASTEAVAPKKQPQQQPQQPQAVELHADFVTRQPVFQPIEIKVSYLRDTYIEADTAFCCLLETSSPYGDRNSVPVLGRGSFSYLGDKGRQEHCVNGASASFLQRAALSITVLLCLCELSQEDEKTVVEFYRQVDKTFDYGYGPYLDYLVYCCQTDAKSRDSYLKHLCLEFNNRFTKDRMTQALTHFVESRQPTQRYYKEAQSAMSQEEMDKDREDHFSVKGRASKASMYLKSASQQHLACCPCHVM